MTGSLADSTSVKDTRVTYFRSDTLAFTALPLAETIRKEPLFSLIRANF